jgi:hypothetical protein
VIGPVGQAREIASPKISEETPWKAFGPGVPSTQAAPGGRWLPAGRTTAASTTVGSCP